MAFLLYTNLFVALCAASLVTSTRLLLGGAVFPILECAGWLELHVFFATLTVYNIDRLVDGEADSVNASERHLWVASHRPLLWGVTAAAALGAVGSMAMLDLGVVLGLMPLAVISFLYSVPILGGELRLKSVPGAKTFVIALVWAIVTVLLPSIELGSATPWWLLAERFVFIFAITLPFELRDLRRDAAAGIRSIAHLLGSRATLWTSVGLLVGFGVSSSIHYAATPPIAAALAATGLGTATVASLGHSPRSDVYYSLLLDGTMLLHSALLLLSAAP